MQRTKHGGSEAVPHTPTQADPRSVVARSKVEEDKGLKAIWQGYAFSEDFREERGHAYMLEDQRLTKRQVVVKQPGACVNCHASMYLAYKKAGNGDITKGFEKINAMPYAEAAKLVSHPVACIDCHDGTTLALRVTRPAFIEGMRAYKASQGVKDYDVNKQASPAEMRAYVCGQCHVEYYFKGPEKRLVYPWAKGLKVEEITAYYDEIGFRDWTHKDTGAPALKAQHPEFETWNQGPHARAGVTCADCHMPIDLNHVHRSLGAQPVLNIQAACVSCHKKHDDKVTAEDLQARVYQIQDRHWALREKAMAAVVALIDDLKAAKAAGRKDADLLAARYLQRRSQFYLDFVEAENSTGFHAPQEARASWASRSTSRARARSRCVTRRSSRPFPWSTFRHRRAGEALRRDGPAKYCRNAMGSHDAAEPQPNATSRSGLMARTWRRLTQPECSLVGPGARRLGFVVGAIAIIGTQVMVHVTGTDEFCGAACHSMQWVAQGTPGEHPWREQHRRARDVPRLPHPQGVSRAPLVQGGGRHQGRHRGDPRHHLHGGEVQGRAKRMAAHVWAEYKANDSRACRGCHQFSKEVLAKQTEMVRRSTRRCSRARRPASTATKGSPTPRRADDAGNSIAMTDSEDRGRQFRVVLRRSARRSRAPTALNETP